MTLKLKRATAGTGNGGFASTSAGLDLNYLFGAASRQAFNVTVAKDGKLIGTSQGGRTSDFDRIVKKEPEYKCEWPLRAVFQLGSQRYAFALDMVSPPPAEESPKDQAQSKDAEGAKDAKPPAPKAMAYNRLYFDLNHNGDLTDDKVIHTKVWRSYVSSYSEDGSVKVIQAPFDVPQIDLEIDVGGTKMDYSFRLLGYTNTSRDSCDAWISLQSAVYRDGEITLAGKKHRVALIDFNSNGRFDDETTLSPEPARDRQIHQRYGDVLFVDPEKFPAATGSLYDWASNSVQHPVGKFINIDGRLYDMQVSPAGDKLTLAPSSAATGSVTNPNGSFCALVYGDKGWLKLIATKDAPAVLPEGQWKLYGYTIERTEPLTPAPPSGPIWTLTAQAMIDYRPVVVCRGETAVMPFGPPYTPTVSGNSLENTKDGQRLSLGMCLVGSVGEVCTATKVNGGRPANPAFTITDDKGNVVQSGHFEYG